MSYIRLSLMTPRPGQEDVVRQLLDDMVLFHEGQPGYLTGYRIEHSNDARRVGRLAVWEHERDASRVALTEHDIALRARLNEAIDEGTHTEETLYGHWAPSTVTG